MVELVLIAAAAAQRAERRRRELLEEHEREVAAAIELTQEIYIRAMDDLTRRYTVRMLLLEADFQRRRCADIVEHFDRGLYVLPSGHVTQIGGEVGRC